MNDNTYDELDDLRGTGAARVSAGGTVASFYTDGRWRDQHGVIVPLDAHGPWTIVKTHKDGM